MLTNTTTAQPTHNESTNHSDNEQERIIGLAPVNGQQMNRSASCTYGLDPTGAVCAVGGGDHNNPRAHNPPHTTVPVSDELIKLFAPYWNNVRDLVDARIKMVKDAYGIRRVKKLLTWKDYTWPTVP
jgi:hypothetical protein